MMELEPEQLTEDVLQKVDEESKYNVDLTICLDVTGSMRGLIADAKKVAFTFGPALLEKMEEMKKPINDLRVKILSFRDYTHDAEPLQSSQFFDLPEEESDLEAYIEGLEAKGGGKAPESSLEAFDQALTTTEWATNKANARHVVVLLTDAPHRSLETMAEKDISNYPANISASKEELEEKWNDDSIIDQNAKRLVLFAPAQKNWKKIANFENTTWERTKAAKGLTETDLNRIVATVCQSIGKAVNSDNNYNQNDVDTAFEEVN
ncbi:vWA domain-containing protein [Halanaerobacter jeridensis]|uniref:VWFA domain-containing protein n=1 Tax=Halanaerobacter jeridensis TaxID=706427 RepID=A0A938XQS6_9FIRM|nr:vWA domain-containing protein [Halanaerobacter jeridensis]MBM7557787.1 hypothetical protein [Halanaerobacter jeridensis]